MAIILINVYLYLALSISNRIIIFTDSLGENGGPMIIYSIILSFYLFILAFTNFQTSMNDYINHLYWFLFILAISATFWFI